MDYLIKNGRVIDPAQNLDDTLDIAVTAGKIEKVGKNLVAGNARVIDAKLKIVAPGLVDMHTHLREPGREDKETVASGTRSAMRGGFTGVCAMPNTEPAIDSPDAVTRLKSIISKDARINVYIVAAITMARAGVKLTDITGLKKAGAVAISDDGSSVDNDEIMAEALKVAAQEKMLPITHSEDTALSAGGVVNQGFIATKMGLRGISSQSEYERIARDIELAKKTQTSVHIAHVSCKESVELIRKAKRSAVHVTAETCPHYFALTEECCVTYDTNTKMNPPLRTREDVNVIKAALADGTIDAIATDHAPHTDSEKDVEFDFAPFGIIGLETALSIAVMELVDTKIISWKDLIARMSTNPTRILGVPGGTLKAGSAADIVIIDPAKEYTYTRELIESKSKNSPFINWKLKAKVTDVFVGGKLVMDSEVII